MNIYLDNVNLNSTSGPNHFATKLKKYMQKNGDTFVDSNPYDAQISFIQKQYSVAPVFQRLDGIYFNKSADYNAQNSAIKKTYNEAKGVIFQSNFNKELTFRYFGKHDNYKVIHNGADPDLIKSTPVLNHPILNSFDNVWSCASSWRPHKRLLDNVKYFLEHSGKHDCMVVAGDARQVDVITDPRVFYVGNLDITTLISLYKKSKYFVHLAYLDHCPNVVVDASFAGCHIICSSTGGTQEVAGNATIIQEDKWDFQPTFLYSPPELDFTKKSENTFKTNIDMAYVSSEYSKFIGE